MAPSDNSPRRRDSRQRTTFGNRFRFLVRVLGLTGALAAPLGWFLAANDLPSIRSWTPDLLSSAIQGNFGMMAHVGIVALAAGLLAILLALLVELFSSLFLAAGRKTAVGTNALLQIGLAIALLIIVNAISLRLAWRFDLTREKEFTLAPELVQDLKTLRSDSPTTVVVLQLHKTAGTLSDKPDAYDYAAERKVVEKVQDLVDQLREFGPRFNVVVLDVEDERYERAVKELTQRRPGLAEAIASAPENSVFFYADEKVRKMPRTDAEHSSSRTATSPDPDDSTQALVYPGSVTRMSFTEFYQLDKTASKEPTTAEREAVASVMGSPAFIPGIRGKGNLVLIPHGNEAFIRKVVALEERRPRVGIAVIHPYLTSRENFDEYTAAGMRKSLEANGFEVTDVILKRWGRGGPPTPAAYTYEESELDRAESRYNLFSLLVNDRETAVKQLGELRTRVDKATLPELDRMFGRQLGRRITAEDDRQLIRKIVDANVQLRQEELAEFTRQQGEFGSQYRDLMRNERAAENRRLTDVKAKLKQYVDECDLLIVPRLTVVDITRGEAGTIPASLFNLNKDQAEVVQEFLKAGKPVLFAMGPSNLDRRGPDLLGGGGDDVEKLIGQLGIELGKQTIITDVEGQVIAERQDETLRTSVDVPALVFDLPTKEGKAPNPVGTAFRVTARAVDRKLDVKKSGYRPVYVSAGLAERLPFVGEMAYTVRESWNEDRPLAEDDSVPKFEPAKPDDPKKGTRDEERRGPFPVGVAIETPIPVEWVDPKFGPQISTAAAIFGADHGLTAAGVTLAAQAQPRPVVRVVVLGHGGLFTGKRLDPAHEALLLHTVNWELHRDDRLPRELADEAKWRFPRTDLAPREYRAWWLGAFLGLPALVIYFGLIALMIRKVR